jgi:aldose 1-epimerase
MTLSASAARPVILSLGGAEMELYPHLGGTVRRLSLVPGQGGDAVDLLAGDEERELEENPWFRGRLLFPFCDRIPGGRYRFEGKEFRLPSNQEDGSAIHGLLYKMPGRLVSTSTTPSARRVDLDWLLGEDAGYPFRLALSVSYRLFRSGSGVAASIAFRVVNRGEGPAPVGFGWHPYFHLPGLSADDMKISIPCEHYVEVREDLMPTGRLVPVGEGLSSADYYDFRHSRSLGKGVYDIAYPIEKEKGESGRTVELSSDTVSLAMNTQGAFSFFQLFTPPDRSAVALEPLSNVTDAFNRDDMGALTLLPGKAFSGSLTLSLRCL